MTAADKKAVFSLLAQARSDRTKLDGAALETFPSPTMAGALDIAIELLDETPAAWKLGGTNEATRAAFNVDRPYFGPLRANEIVESGARLNKADYPAPLLAEPEIAITFNRDFESTQEKRTLDDIADAIDWIAPAVELPATVLTNPPAAGVDWLVADRCAAGALVVGRKLQPNELEQLEQASISIAIDGAQIQIKQNNLIGGVLKTLQDMLRVFGDYNLALSKGVIVATGGLVPAINIQDAENLEVRFDDHAVDVSV